MAARYVVRFDDVTPSMNWRVWDKVEALLERHGVRPVVAVVPENRDPSLNVAPPEERFWERVRGWQRRGWTIAVHGHQHVYETRERGVIGLNPQSEFAGLPRAAQEAKLRAALAKFESEGVLASVWIAPAHSFDETTLELLAELGPWRISDGFFLYPFTDERGLQWVPQQLWRFEHRPFGVWTVCLHINRWAECDVARFGKALAAYSPFIDDFETISADYAWRRKGVTDAVVHRAYLRYLGALGVASRLRRRAMTSR